MPVRVCEAQTVLVVTLSVLVVASYSKPLPRQNKVVPYNSSSSHPEQKDQHVLMGNCTGYLDLLYVETVTLTKDANSLVNGSIEVNLDSTIAPFAIACVKIHPKSEHDRLALTSHRFLGPKQFTIDVQEQPPQQERNMQYEILVYRALPVTLTG